jgi:ligand-binding SRPBCC domain-containing protein
MARTRASLEKPVTEFVYRSVIPAPAAAVFAWHEGPQALLDLLPRSRWVRLEERSGGIRDGGLVTIGIGLGRWRLRWRARHFGYVAGRQFCDEQIAGPFARWRHTHRVEAIGTRHCVYEDRVEFAVPGGRQVNLVLAGPLTWALRRMFRARHAIVRARVVRTVVPQRICSECRVSAQP